MNGCSHGLSIINSTWIHQRLDANWVLSELLGKPVPTFVWPLDSPGKLLGARNLYCAFKFLCPVLLFEWIFECFQVCSYSFSEDRHQQDWRYTFISVLTHFQIIWSGQLLKKTIPWHCLKSVPHNLTYKMKPLQIEFYFFSCSDNQLYFPMYANQWNTYFLQSLYSTIKGA